MTDKCFACGATDPGNVGDLKMCFACYQNPLGPKLVEQAELIRQLTNPTLEMLEAGQRAWSEHEEDDFSLFQDIYYATIAVALRSVNNG